MEFYSTSARILDVILESSAPVSLKAICTEHAAKTSPTRCYAILAETLKYLPVLEKLLKSVDLLKTEAKVLSKKASPTSRALVLVMMHDLLFSKKGIALPKEHKVRQAVERDMTRLKANLQREKIKRKATSNEALQVSIQHYINFDVKGKQRNTDGASGDPDSLEGKLRWLRVNEIKWTVEEAVDWMKSNGWTQRKTLRGLATSGPRSFCIDEHIPNLLALPFHGVSLPKFPPYQDARLIAQDKASCMPAYLLLNDTARSDLTVLDATSAPGNKTSYASATLSTFGSGQVFAFERDGGRFGTLQKMMRKAGCTNVTNVHADFLEVEPTEEPYCQATHILVDPSCSGSGIHDDGDEATADADLQARLTPLSKFQRYILSHALSFPKAEKVVYSTCSIHQEEDEEVVFSVLEREEIGANWELARREHVLPDWPIRGQLPSEDADAEVQEQTEGLIRCERRMGTHGFFVAVFVRKGTAGRVPVAAPGVTATDESMEAEEEALMQADDVEEPSLCIQDASMEELDKPDFSLLRLATLDRLRREQMSAMAMAEDLRGKGKLKGCGCC